MDKAILRFTRCTYSHGKHIVCSPFLLPSKHRTRSRALNVTQIRSASFARDLACGHLNMDWIFPYPTMKTEDDLDELNQLAEAVEKFFKDKVDSAKMDRDAKFDPEAIKGLKELGLFGMQIPVEYGGLGLSNVQYARVIEEVSRDGAISVMLAAHQAIGLKGILIAGNADQKQKYLPKLATGEHTAAFCLTEPSSGSDAASIQTKARLSEDGKHWIINGNKIWITNGGFADVMTVFAKTEVLDRNDEVTEKVTAFIVERNFGGITSGPPEDKLGIRASNTCSVTFEDTPVPVENVLGEVAGGFKIAMTILNSGRFSMGSSVAGQIKRIIKDVTEHANSRQQFGHKLSSFPIIQEKICKLATQAYAMESMAYMTAGQMDRLDDEGTSPDCSIEAAMVKIYSSEAAWSAVSECIQIFGGMGYMKDLPYERWLRDARILLIFEGTNEILRMYVGLASLQYAGAKLQHRIRLFKQGNRRERVTAAWDQLREEFQNFRPPSFGFFNESQTKTWLDPRLEKQGHEIEQLVELYRKRIFHALKLYGKHIQTKQLLIKTFSDAAINIYAMTAVLSRSNKALILSLRNSDHDHLMATTFITKTYLETWAALENVAHTNILEHDFANQLSEKMLEEERYVFSHPLDVTHNFLEHPKYVEQLNKIKELTG